MNANLRQRAYEHIRHKLVTGQLGPGERLSNRELAREIEISTIPVREALTQLTSEGFFEHRPGVGIFVVDLSSQDLEDLLDVREALECHGIRKAAAKITETEIEELMECWREMAAVLEDVLENGCEYWEERHVEPWTLADARLHLTLLRVAGNRRALKIVSDLRVMACVFAYQDIRRTTAQLERALKEHEAIIEAVGKRDADLAFRLMAEHLGRKRATIMQVYNRSRMEREPAGAPPHPFSRSAS